VNPKGCGKRRFSVATTASRESKQLVKSTGRVEVRNATWLVGVLSLGLAACGQGKTPAPLDTGQSQEAAPQARDQADGSTGEAAALVGLDGVITSSRSPANLQLPQMYARSFKTWVFSEPRPDAQRLGYLRLGSSVAMKPDIVGRVGCGRGWYALLERGFVCLDDSATLDAKDPVVSAMSGLAPNLSRKLPYIYGTVRRPGPVYRRVPTASEAAREEPDLAARYERWLSAPGENGASYGQQIWLAEGLVATDPAEAWRNKQSEPLPEFLRNGKALPRIPGEPVSTTTGLVLDNMAPRLGYSLLQTFLVEGRRYGLTTRFEVVPTDRLRPIQGSEYHGFRIPQDVDFPFAIVRQPGAMLYQYETKTKKLRPKEHAAYRSALKLTGKQSFFRGKLHYETDAGDWVSDRDASRLDPVKKMPAWGTNGEKWIDINVTKQTLALYEGTRAVYATLVSTGEAGLSDPEKSTATKRGIYRIHTKHISATMDSDVVGEEFELRDVPYVQYFESNYALHGAYWHDRFGIPKSHGCINLAPEDARRIFSWTEPRVPNAWHGALLPLKGTVLFVHP
jgi:hypothetical protein